MRKTKDKIVLYNPHCDDFIAQPLLFKILGRRALKKYSYLSKVTQEYLVDYTSSGLFPNRVFNRFPFYLRYLVIELEIFFWLWLNPSFSSHKRLKISQEDVSEKILLVFSYKGVVGHFNEKKAIFESFKYSIFHLSHYFINTREKAECIRSLRNYWLAGDNQITKNEYFNYFFPDYEKPFLIIPFSVAPRFRVLSEWGRRSPLCIAMGTVHNLKYELPSVLYKDFRDFFKLDTYHPIRREILNVMDTDNFQININEITYDTFDKSRKISLLIKILKKRIQRKYFSLELPEIYNSFKFSIVGEEASGFIALGSLEAAACGSIPIINSECLGGTFIENSPHILRYDGTYEDLMLQLKLSRFKDYSIQAEHLASLIKSMYSDENLILSLQSVIEDML